MLGRLKNAVVGWVEDQAAQMGAALAYYTLFSLTPLLVIAIAIIGALLGEAETREQVVSQVARIPRHGQRRRGSPHARELPRDACPRPDVPCRSGLAVVRRHGHVHELAKLARPDLRLPSINEGVVKGLLRTYLLAVLMVFVSCTFLTLLLLVSMVMPLLYLRWAELFPGAAGADRSSTS